MFHATIKITPQLAYRGAPGVYVWGGGKKSNCEERLIVTQKSELSFFNLDGRGRKNETEKWQLRKRGKHAISGAGSSRPTCRPRIDFAVGFAQPSFRGSITL